MNYKNERTKVCKTKPISSMNIQKLFSSYLNSNSCLSVFEANKEHK